MPIINFSMTISFSDHFTGKNIFCCFIFLLLFSTQTLAGNEMETTEEARLLVSLESSLLSVNTVNKPLYEVLLAIAEAANVHISIHGDLDRPLTESFTGLSVDEGIRRLIDKEAVVMFYGYAGDSVTKRLNEVWVYSHSEGVALNGDNHTTTNLKHVNTSLVKKIKHTRIPAFV